MTASSSNANSAGNGSRLVLYDIAFERPYEKSACAPNPWKARYALNFKGVPYSTKWTHMHNITKVRQSLEVPAGRQFADGTDYYTLPIVTDLETKISVGDSFDIADYLQITFPDEGAGDLFPPQQLNYECPVAMNITVPLSKRKDMVHTTYARFNTNVDAVFTMHVQLAIQGMRWDPEFADDIKAIFMQRAGVKSWDDFKLDDEARDKLKVSLRNGLCDLAVMFQKDTTGPFLLGKQASYADIIVGGWLCMFSKALPEKDWAEMETWHDGAFGKLHEALQQQFGDMK